MQIIRKMQRCLFAHFKGHFLIFFWSFDIYCKLKPPPLSPVPSQFLLRTMIIHHRDCHTFSFPWDQLPITLIKDGEWRRRRRGLQVWLQFQTPLDFLLLRKRALGKHKGCFLFFPPNDKSQCFPDMTRISKMAVQRMQ